MSENRVNYTSISTPGVLLVDMENARTAVEYIVDAVKLMLLKNEPDPANISTINKLLSHLMENGLMPYRATFFCKEFDKTAYTCEEQCERCKTIEGAKLVEPDQEDGGNAKRT